MEIPLMRRQFLGRSGSRQKHPLGLRSLSLLAVPCVLLACSGCKQQKTSTGDPKSVIARVNKEKTAARLPVLGERRLEGDGQELRASADGEVLTVLMDAVHPPIQGVPPP